MSIYFIDVQEKKLVSVGGGETGKRGEGVPTPGNDAQRSQQMDGWPERGTHRG